MEFSSLRPLQVILVPMAAALLILASGRRQKLREAWTLLASLLQFLLVVSMIPAVTGGDSPAFFFFEILPGIRTLLKVDALGIYFALLASGLWILTSIYSFAYMRALKEHEQTRYFAAFALSLAATMGIAFAGDLLSFFIFYEMLTISTYPLVAHHESREAILAGRKYLVYSLSAGVCLLIAMAWTMQAAGSLQFTPGGFVAGAFASRSLFFLFFLLIYGCGVKAALFPVHAWLPTAMVAPTPVSALLHAVAVVKAGVFGILRMVGYVFGPAVLKDSGLGFWLAVLASATILIASAMALTQDNLKRRLAYSTISQLSYIILGAALLSPSAFSGSVLHLANHALMKITLFFIAGVIYIRTHKENISEMAGIGYQLPGMFIAFAAAAAGLSGFPPFCGFVSKWFLGVGAVESGAWGFLAVYLVSALLNAAYFFPIVLQAFSRKGPPAPPPAGVGSFALVFPIAVTALLVVLLGSIPSWIHAQKSLADLAASGVFRG